MTVPTSNFEGLQPMGEGKTEAKKIAPQGDLQEIQIDDRDEKRVTRIGTELDNATER